VIDNILLLGLRVARRLEAEGKLDAILAEHERNLSTQNDPTSYSKTRGGELNGKTRDLLEQALDVRIELLQRATESHERAISGQVMPMCRQYEACDPSHRELCAIAQKRIAVASCGSDGDVA